MLSNKLLTVIEQFEKGLAIDTSRANQIEDYIDSHFVITGDYQWTSHPWLLQLDMATFLTGSSVANLLENANQLSPRESGQAWHRAFF